MMTTTAEILLVDDNPADLDLTIDALAQSPWQTHVSTVSDGTEAMAYLCREGKYAEASRPHLVLLDLNLPRKDGRSVLAEMKSRPGSAPDTSRDFQHVTSRKGHRVQL